MNIKVSITLDVKITWAITSAWVKLPRGVEYVLQRAHLSKRIAEQLDGMRTV